MRSCDGALKHSMIRLLSFYVPCESARTNNILWCDEGMHLWFDQTVLWCHRRNQPKWKTFTWSMLVCFCFFTLEHCILSEIHTCAKAKSQTKTSSADLPCVVIVLVKDSSPIKLEGICFAIFLVLDFLLFVCVFCMDSLYSRRNYTSLRGQSK